MFCLVLLEIEARVRVLLNIYLFELCFLVVEFDEFFVWVCFVDGKKEGE